MVQEISLIRLVVIIIPALFTVAIFWFWQLDFKHSIYALFRMVLQLLLVGFFLSYIFGANSPTVIVALVFVMLCIASWIALRTIPQRRKTLYRLALISISTSGIFVLAIVSQIVLKLSPWYNPRLLIPLAGMIFSNSMTSVSLAAERFFAESARGVAFKKARNTAFFASLIPLLNSLFAVGLVSLPGMMTGQILAGVSPLIAVRYQIMVMCMLFGASGLSSFLFLVLLGNKLHKKIR